jgi:hypothetical protein
MDFFNKKKIESLETDIKKLWNSLSIKDTEIRELKTAIIEPRCFGSYDRIPENTFLNDLANHVQALENYLDVNITSEYVNDPQYLPEPPKQMRIYKATKRFKSKKGSKI